MGTEEATVVTKPRKAAKRSAAPKADKVLLDAVDLAREAALSIATPNAVGEHEGAVMLGERLAMHYFTCTNKGYHGWRWAIAVARAPRAKVATVCETNLLPGDEALLSPEWVPYDQRLAPGDVGPGDVLPYIADDPNLEPGFEATGEEDVDQMAFFELGLGRTRVLSREGRESAAQRWYDGDNGPGAAVATQAKGNCSSCGYFLPMAGVLRQSFGVCANEWSSDDGRVVSLDHGCGAHSEVHEAPSRPEPIDPPVLDDFAIDIEAASESS
ncbi:DUF3027 domain-containing protein [Yimella sp. cx-51]|uniref:DUF3027 domain-containing protein n=1 Tax=Yimella sp. cx-51 TaxID=2770551 RepID=UPI00165EBB6A|nr:DUF3027 domain-containing protein [Yimella sp. cx-51]MBC9956308.1 DUF3027 domain-containing protein [Yimella sp. cx-51]QTH38557.1 DUF3027 domain-containing protein [Yimella sp. cx-51]